MASTITLTNSRVDLSNQPVYGRLRLSNGFPFRKRDTLMRESYCGLINLKDLTIILYN